MGRSFCGGVLFSASGFADRRRSGEKPDRNDGRQYSGKQMNELSSSGIRYPGTETPDKGYSDSALARNWLLSSKTLSLQPLRDSPVQDWKIT